MITLQVLKVGIVSCSGEAIPEGTISRIACRKVLDELRPGETVTICLPLFLAGGEEEREFAKNYPTITVDGCEKRCAQKSTEKLSGKPSQIAAYSRYSKKTRHRAAHKPSEPEGRGKSCGAGRSRGDCQGCR